MNTDAPSPSRILVPWDRRAAVRAMLLLLLTSAAVATVDALVSRPGPRTSDRIATAILPLTLLGLSALVSWSSTKLPDFLFTALPLAGVLGVCASALATRDGGAASQLFFCLPILFAATQLPAAMAYLVLTCATVADAAIVFTLLSFDDAVSDWLYGTVTFMLLTVLLVRAGRDQRQLADILREQAMIDPLTGLVTRRVLDEAAQSAIVGARGEEGTALIVIDVDKFKSVNDTYGHPVGDRVLVHIADMVRAHARNDAMISRLGGDEIAVLLPGCTYNAAVQRAEQIVSAIRAHPLLLRGGTILPMAVSAGVAHAPSHALDHLSLYEAADQALYSAKRAGRDRVGTIARGVLGNEV